MKKYLVLIAIIITILCINKKEEIIIPDNSIRFRVIANSNTIEDQLVKKQIVNTLKEEIIEIESKSNTIEESRDNINKSIKEIEKKVNKETNNNIKIDYGYNYFPRKVYRGVIYNEGMYESLVITLGEGKGNNFWCVLFPPLCNIDEKEENIEYTSLVKEIINKYAKKA